MFYLASVDLWFIAAVPSYYDDTYYTSSNKLHPETVTSLKFV